MSEYGYIPEAPEQSFGNNKGIFNPKDIYDLTRADKYTNYGQLELIETQTASSVSSINFTDIKEDIYNVHFLTFNNQLFADDRQLAIKLYENGSVSTNTYQYALQYGTAGGTFNEARSTSLGELLISANAGGGGSDRERNNGYVYFYNLGDSTKYSFVTFHNFILNSTSTGTMNFGSGVLPQASTVDGIQIIMRATGGTIDEGDFSLYGIKEYS